MASESEQPDPKNPENPENSEYSAKNGKPWLQQRADLYQQLAPGESMLPPWAQKLYIWTMGTLFGGILFWLIFRLFGATRGDLVPAIIATVIGVIIGTSATIWFSVRQKRKK